jgi:hypothetical protein
MLFKLTLLLYDGDNCWSQYIATQFAKQNRQACKDDGGVSVESGKMQVTLDPYIKDLSPNPTLSLKGEGVSGWEPPGTQALIDNHQEVLLYPDRNFL